MSDCLAEAIRRDHRSGMTIWEIQQRYHWVQRTQIRRYLRKNRAEKPPESDPDEAEIERRRDQIRASWSPETAAKRWVGRYSTQAESRGSSLSKILRDLGGDG